MSLSLAHPGEAERAETRNEVDGLKTTVDSADPDAKMIVDTFDPILVSVHQDAFVRFWDMEVSPCVDCLLYTSPSPRDAHRSRMPSSA